MPSRSERTSIGTGRELAGRDPLARRGDAIGLVAVEQAEVGGSPVSCGRP